MSASENLKATAWLLGTATVGYVVWQKYGNKTESEKQAETLQREREGKEALRKEQDKARIDKAEATDAWYDRYWYNYLVRAVTPVDTVNEYATWAITNLRNVISTGNRVWIKRRPTDANGQVAIVRLEWDGTANKPPLVTRVWNPNTRAWKVEDPPKPLHTSWGRQWMQWPDVSPEELGQKKIG